MWLMSLDQSLANMEEVMLIQGARVFSGITGGEGMAGSEDLEDFL